MTNFKPIAKLQAEVAKDCVDCHKDDAIKPAKLAAMIEELYLLGAIEECQARELEKRALGEVSENEARYSLQRLQKLEEGRPTVDQLGRGAAVGAVVGPLAALAGRAISGRSVRAPTDQQFLPHARQLLAQAGTGGIFGGLAPALTSKIERGAEVKKLKGYLEQHEPQEAKVAFGEKAIKSVLGKVKSLQVKAPDVEDMTSGLPYNAWRPDVINKMRDIGLQRLGTVGVVGDEAESLIAPTLNFAKSVTRNGSSITVPKKGDALTALKSNPLTEGMAGLENTRLDPKNRRALDALLKGHELAETQVKPSNEQYFSHLSPDVMLREHNMIATLPKELSGAGKVMKNLREPLEAQNIKRNTGIEFGEGPRFSRHARKHLTSMIEKGDAARKKTMADLTAKGDYAGIMKLVDEGM